MKIYFIIIYIVAVVVVGVVVKNNVKQLEIAIFVVNFKIKKV